MLVLIDNVRCVSEEKCENTKHHRRKSHSADKTSRTLKYDRYCLRINGVLCYVLSADRSFFLSDDAAGLYKAFKGDIIASAGLCDISALSENLFNIKPFYRKYAAEYFADFIKNLSIPSFTVAFFDRTGEYTEYMSAAFSKVKRIEFHTDSARNYSELIAGCYSEYGFYPEFFSYHDSTQADITADIDEVAAGGLLQVAFFGETRVISPSLPYYKLNAESLFLLQNGINRDYLTAAFYDSVF